MRTCTWAGGAVFDEKRKMGLLQCLTGCAVSDLLDPGLASTECVMCVTRVRDVLMNSGSHVVR